MQRRPVTTSRAWSRPRWECLCEIEASRREEHKKGFDENGKSIVCGGNQDHRGPQGAGGPSNPTRAEDSSTTAHDRCVGAP